MSGHPFRLYSLDSHGRISISPSIPNAHKLQALVDVLGHDRSLHLMNRIDAEPAWPKKIQIITQTIAALPPDEKVKFFHQSHQDTSNGSDSRGRHALGGGSRGRLAARRGGPRGRPGGGGRGRGAALGGLGGWMERLQVGSAGRGRGLLSALNGAVNVQTERPHFGVALDASQKDEFARNGFLILRDVVPAHLIRTAKGKINASLGKGIPSAQVEAFNVSKGGFGWFPELASTSPITNILYQSPLYEYAESLVGKMHRCRRGQIALRFPGKGCVESDEGYDPLPGVAQAWHIDGVPHPLSPLPRDHVLQFTMLVGVLLQDVPSPFMGNLVVHPGSHLVIQEYLLRNKGAASLLMDNSRDAHPEELKFPRKSVQVTGKAGDVVLLHYQTAHGVAPNASPEIRYATYFRLTHVDHEPGMFRPEAMTNVWLEYDGMRE